MHQVTYRDLADAVDGRFDNVDNVDMSFERLKIDSRQIQPRDLFWAIKGETHDGHDFASQAVEQGACLSVVSASRDYAVPGPKLVVGDTIKALGQFARWYRQQFDTMVIGVTGSVGKTTTREMVYAALGSQFHGLRSLSNFNNLIGLPLSLLEMSAVHEFAVIEMGASSIGDINDLCEIACPEIGIITAVGPAHVQTFGSLEAIIQTKGELLEQLPTSGFAVLPGDDPITRMMADRAPCPVIFTGIGDDNQIRASQVEVFPHLLKFHCEGQSFAVPVVGRHSLSSALSAIAVGLEIGIPTRTLAEGLAQFKPVPGRCGVLQIGPWNVIDDSYNASPLAVAAACRLLQEMPVLASGKRMLILGDMRELGELARGEHEKIGRLAAELGIDRLLVCGDHANDVARGAKSHGMSPHHMVAADNCETLIAILDCWIQPDDLLLVKGSRATRMERVIEWLRVRATSDDPHNRGQRRICA